MTTTLLLRLTGPMQSWGTQSRFRDRDSGGEPSKSGVIGLLCAALGRPREAPVDDLAALRMGVRIDHAGIAQRDYQTAGGVHRKGEQYGVAVADGAKPRAALSSRVYLADASFLVGLEATMPEQESLLRQIDAALAAPVWPLFLGRKSYPPSKPVRLPDAPPVGPGLLPKTLEAALHAYDGGEPLANRVMLVIECDPDDPHAEARNDWPLSFVSADRRFATRYVKTTFSDPVVSATDEPTPEGASGLAAGGAPDPDVDRGVETRGR